MLQVSFTRAAREDLITIWTHIAEDNPQAADRVLDRLEGAANRLAESPQIGPARDDIRPGLRYLVSGPYLLLYRIRDGRIEIVRAVHGRRDLSGLFRGEAGGVL
jgi:toxin ParE1/3/4